MGTVEKLDRSKLGGTEESERVRSGYFESKDLESSNPFATAYRRLEFALEDLSEARYQFRESLYNLLDARDHLKKHVWSHLADAIRYMVFWLGRGYSALVAIGRDGVLVVVAAVKATRAALSLIFLR